MNAPPPSWLSWLTYRRVGLIAAGGAIVGLGVFALRRDPGGPVRPLLGSRRSLGAALRRTFRIGDLPRDMREELFNEHATSVDAEATEQGFFRKRVPAGRIEITNLQVDRYPADQVASYIGDLPPIVIADGRLLDGGHRITAARARGETHLRYIDVSGLIDTDSMGFISKLPAGVLSGPPCGRR